MTEKDRSPLILEVTSKSPPVVRADDYKTIYCSASTMSLTPWDIRFTVGQIVDAIQGGTVNEQKVTVVMAPSHAKAVLKNWVATLRAYEDAFGEVADIGAIRERSQKAPKVAEASTPTVPSRRSKGKKD